MTNGSVAKDMLIGHEIADAKLDDWRKLAQGLHARYLFESFQAGTRFLAAIGEAGEEFGHFPRIVLGNGFIDLKLVSQDAIFRDGDGNEYVVEWVTQQDIDLARRITEIAKTHDLRSDSAAVSDFELGLDVKHSATVAPVWAALLTGNAESQGRGTPGDEIRDASGRVPNLWFGDLDPDSTDQRIHFEIYVPLEAREQRIAATIAAGGAVLDDSNAPSLTVIADQEGNRGILCVDAPAAAAI